MPQQVLRAAQLPIGVFTHSEQKAAGDTSSSLYDRNRDVYDLLRYGVRVRPEAGENTETVWLIDWKKPELSGSQPAGTGSGVLVPPAVNGALEGAGCGELATEAPPRCVAVLAPR